MSPRTPLVDAPVPDALAGERLDRALAALAPGLSRVQARKLIDGGTVFVQGKRARVCSRTVSAGERVQAFALAEARAQGEPEVLAERSGLLVVNKPAGMPVEATRGGVRGTLVDWFATRAQRRILITHRLDAATSGVIACATHAQAQAELNRMFAERLIERRYVGVVAPAPPWERYTFARALDDKPAVTHARVQARSPDGAFALVAFSLATGRTRQIRRHVAADGFPLVGDRDFGGAPGPRLLLHADTIELTWARERLVISAPLPDAIQAALRERGLTLQGV